MSACVILVTDRQQDFTMCEHSEVYNSIKDFITTGRMNSIEVILYSGDELPHLTNTVMNQLGAVFGLRSDPFHADWADDKKSAAYKRDRHMFRVARRAGYKPADIVVVAITGNEDLAKSQRPAQMIREAERKGFNTHHVSITDHWKMEF